MMSQRNQLMVLIGSLILLVAVPLVIFFTLRQSETSETPTDQTAQQQNQRDQRRTERPTDEDPQVPSLTCEYSLDWGQTAFMQSVGVRPYNVTDMLVAEDGSVYAAFNDDENLAYVARTTDEGNRWQVSDALPNATSIRVLRQLSDGRFLVGVTGRRGDAILFESEDGLDWEPLAQNVLPNTTATSVWDILELDDGRVLLATDSQDNNPNNNNPALYVLEGARVSELASFPGLGLLAMDVNEDGVIVVATEQSDEHDDPILAGQSRIFLSKDGGETWKEGGVPEDANRIYDLHFHSSGDLYAGSGISGELLRSQDDGLTWEQMTHVPSAELPFGERGETRDVEASRVYQILELCDGAMLVGTGNNGGDVFYTDDGGKTWQQTDNTGPNNVVWGLAQAPDGTIWIGTGSHGGDVLVAHP